MCCYASCSPRSARSLETVVPVLHEEPLRPSRLQPRLPRDLETICVKCLAKEPARRYPSAKALADDLQRFRKGKPILARPDSRYLAYCGGDGTARVWDVDAGVDRVVYRGHTAAVESVQFSPDSQRLVSSSPLQAAVKVWDFTRHPEHATFARVRGRVDQRIKVAFSPDGRRLAGFTQDVVKMWDVDTGQEVLTLQGAPLRHWDSAFNPRVAFSPDGKRLVGTNWDESISLWDAPDQGADTAKAQHQAARLQAANARAVFWHLEEAEDCVEHHKRSAAIFHLQRLGNTPLPGPLQARQERLARQLRP